MCALYFAYACVNVIVSPCIVVLVNLIVYWLNVVSVAGSCAYQSSWLITSFKK